MKFLGFKNSLILFILFLGFFLIQKFDFKNGVFEHKLANLFEFVIFMPFHNEIAEHFYIEATKKNNFEAQCDTGMFYESQKDFQKSGYWYLQSSLNGWWRCEDDFEKYNYPDEQAVFAMLKTKADSPNIFAQYMVGKRYIEAKGVRKNVHEGMKYLKLAAIRGSRGAQLYLAGLYLKGSVIPKDAHEAEKWVDMSYNK